MRNAYFRFLTLVAKLDHEHPVRELDIQTRQLLDLIAINHDQGTPLTVTTAMSLSSIASPATIHRKLEELKAQGLVDVQFQNANMRTKYLVPTAISKKRYEKLDREMVKSFRLS